MPKPLLTISILAAEAKEFAAKESKHAEPTLFGVTDGKAVGTYLELKFRKHLAERYTFEQGSAAKGVDFPDIGVDVKVTSDQAAAVVVPLQDRASEDIRPRILVAVVCVRENRQQQGQDVHIEDSPCDHD